MWKFPLVPTAVCLERTAGMLFWGAWTGQPVCAFSFDKRAVKSPTCRAEIYDPTYCLISLSAE